MTMRDFRLFKGPLQQHFNHLYQNYDLYRVKLDKDLLWTLYLTSYPDGTNNIFRTRKEYDCSCCRQFVRAVGDVVAIVDNKIVTLWDTQCDDPVYQQVADALALYVRHQPIDNVFRSIEHVAGVDKTFEQITSSNGVGIVDPIQTWNHFFINIPKELVVKKEDLGPKQAETRAQHDVLLRSLTDIRDDAIETVLDLITQGSLYRGNEQQKTVKDFQLIKERFVQVPTEYRDNFVWSLIDNVAPNLAKIRNTSIGTLLVDLSEGMELDAAVRRFEAIMAPANYKRPTALITQKMIDAAKAKLTELGLVSALDRRYAKLTDLTIGNLLFVDRVASKAIRGDVFDTLTTKAQDVSKLARVDEVSIEAFIHEVLPRITTLEVMVENRLASNLVSLVTATDATAPSLFKWDNAFSWSYKGDFADSIKERVKAAGGNVTGDLLCRLSWNNTDDLDLHMVEPGGYEIFFGNKRIMSPNGGMLDVDMNVSGETRTPVENIFYSNRQTMREGKYTLFVHQFTQRESIDVGFTVEFDYRSNLVTYEHPAAVKYRSSVVVVSFDYTHKDGINVVNSLPPSTRSKTIWNMKTQDWHRVNALLLSPNYWGDRQVGNKHYFFMLDGCRNDEEVRGFYNEFLKEELTAHRKVIEMVGARMRTEETENQLSGLGFSSTQRNSMLVRVTGAYTRTLKVIF